MLHSECIQQSSIAADHHLQECKAVKHGRIIHNEMHSYVMITTFSLYLWLKSSIIGLLSCTWSSHFSSSSVFSSWYRSFLVSSGILSLLRLVNNVPVRLAAKRYLSYQIDGVWCCDQLHFISVRAVASSHDQKRYRFQQTIWPLLHSAAIVGVIGRNLGVAPSKLPL